MSAGAGGPAGTGALTPRTLREDEGWPSRGYPLVLAVRAESRRCGRRIFSRNLHLPHDSGGRAEISDKPSAGTFPDGRDAGCQGSLVRVGTGDGHFGAIRRQEPEPEIRIGVNKRFEPAGHGNPSSGPRVYIRVSRPVCSRSRPGGLSLCKLQQGHTLPRQTKAAGHPCRVGRRRRHSWPVRRSWTGQSLMRSFTTMVWSRSGPTPMAEKRVPDSFSSAST